MLNDENSLRPARPHSESSLVREKDITSEFLNVKEELQCSSLARENDLTSELLKVKEEFAAEIETCSILKSDLTSELLNVKGEFTAEIETCSILKSR